ncbi:MAG: hypothetical protein RMM98_11875 [Acidobacteriota bacterium]|nr:hypothetical protein [Blastocatellia bacterium]MDW8240307.1 hypothetical protein [Acidobacteriota bacterium]
MRINERADAQNQWTVAVVSGRWRVVSGRWRVVSGRWTVVGEQWLVLVVVGQWSVRVTFAPQPNQLEWLVVSGWCSVGGGQWLVGGGR